MPTAAAVLIASTRAGPSIAAITVIPPTCRSRHRGPRSASRCAVLLPQPDLPTPNLRRDACRPPRAARPPHAAARRGAGQGRPRLRRCGRRPSPHALHMPASPRDRAAARHPACRCPTRQLHSASASTIGRSGRAAVYGTIVVDIDRRRVIDLLPDRTAPTVAGWLERHSGVELVARDRSTEYARGASLGAPQAQQVADRWHLLTNIRQAVERWLHGAHARLRSLPILPGSTAHPARRSRAFARSTTELEAGAQSRMRWQASYDEVRRGTPAGAPARDRPCHGAGSCDGAQV